MTVRQHLEILAQDVRYAVRGFRRSPGFTCTAIVAIALGAGAGAAVFSVVDRILFRSLPYAQAERLVSFGFTAPIFPQEFMLGTDYLEWRGRQQPFAEMTSWSGIRDCDLTAANPVRLDCAQVEANFLPALGVQPIAGRNFTRAEDLPNAPPVALITYGLWRSRYAGDRGVVGRTIPLDGRAATIVGILPRDFELPTLEHADVVVPQAMDEAQQRRPQTGRVLEAVARLKPGVTAEQATAALQPLFQESLKYVPGPFRKEVHLRVRSVRDRQIHDARLPSWILFAAVLAVLLIACANVANLLLARAAGRRREIAVRLALGASRGRLVRQTLTESILLALSGALAGALLAAVLLRIFVAIAPQGIPRLEQAALDPRVLAFTLAAGLVSGLAFGLVPALDRPPAESLAGWRSAGARQSLFRQGMVAGQIAVSLVLLTGASLLLRSLWNMENQPLGMRTGRVLAATVTLSAQTYRDDASQSAFFERLEDGLRRIPGVAHLAIGDSTPLSGTARSTIYSVIEVAGRPRAQEGTGGMVIWRAVTPDYFAALGIPIVRGRAFTERDRDPRGHTVVLSEALASRLFPGEEALGKQIQQSRSGEWLTVVGIAGNVKNGPLMEADSPEFYEVRKHTPQAFGRTATAVLESPLDPETLTRMVRAAVAQIDPGLPVETETFDSRLGKLAERPRFNAWVLSLFAGMALALAAVGLYGAMAFQVAQRTREIGVRMALGATRGGIARLVLGQAARWTLAGTVMGAAGSWFAVQMLGSMLYQAPARDPWIMAAATAVLCGTSLAAAWIPSRRAARVDPMAALRQE